MKLTGGAIVARALADEGIRYTFGFARDADVLAVLAHVRDRLEAGRAVLVDVAIDCSRRTFFTAGVVKTNLLRCSWPERLRFVGRALKRRLLK